MDWDGDGINDLVVGNMDGTLHFVKGSRAGKARAFVEQNLLHGLDSIPSPRFVSNYFFLRLFNISDGFAEEP